ncbi:MFS transporter [Natranaerofaba carboxydovora]|uniref:MFS transporter n=1 Tax=Natranaerofaba carboxydovora TaxID=2742683 RepID=UPI001F14282B|nr:MFS transporter [Natranaerofaba carboxydovora]UMZ74454.1 Purine efflux pump PbuE [Natranaerofaba carboxydovora]
MQEKHKKMLLILGIIAFFANGDNYAAAPLLPDIARDLDISISQAAFSVTAYMASFGLFTIIFGPLGDRFGKSKIINIAAFGTAIFSTLAAFSFNLPSLIILRGINGAFAAGIFPVTMALIGETFSDEHRQNAIGKVMGMMFMGAASATALGGALAYLGNWRLVYGFYGIAELVTALIMIKVLVKSKGVVDELKYREVYGKAFGNKLLLKTVGTIFIIGFAIFGSFTYAGSYVEEQTGLNLLMVGVILSSFGAATVLGGRKASWFREKAKDKYFIFAGILGSISLLLLSISSSVFTLIIFLFGFGLSFVLLQSSMIMRAQQVMPQLKGTAMSLASFNMFVGGAVGTFTNGIILDATRMSNIFLLAGVIMFFVAFLTTRVVLKPL